MECQACPLQPVIDAFVKSDNLHLLAHSKHRKLRDAAEHIQSALSAVCLACAHSANDDNPSNHGQSFVSLDRSIEAPNNSKSTSLQVADYLLSKRRPDVHAQDPNGCSGLPPSVEETLKIQFANFAALSPIDLCLVAHLMGGGSFATFATMSWLPHLPYDPITLQPIPVSRQAIHARFRNIVRKIPVLAVLAQKISADPTNSDNLPSPTASSSNTKTHARRFSSISAIGRSNSRLVSTRKNPVLHAPASKRDTERRTAAAKSRALADSLQSHQPVSSKKGSQSRTASKRRPHPLGNLQQMTLF